MDEKIRDAYRQMEPTDEQIGRMWENVRARAEKGPGAGSAAQEAIPGGRLPGEAESRAGSFPIGPGPHLGSTPKPNAKRGKLKAWKVAIPIAACLVLGAVAVSVSSASNPMADNASVQHDLRRCVSIPDPVILRARPEEFPPIGMLEMLRWRSK